MSLDWCSRQQGTARRRSHLGFSLAACLTAGLLCLSPAIAGQASGVNQGGPDYLHAPAGSGPMPHPGMSEEAAKIEQMRQAERHKRIQNDTAKLLELSTQLKSTLDTTPRDQLSVDAIRKASEIEKTAHDLRQWLQS